MIKQAYFRGLTKVARTYGDCLAVTIGRRLGNWIYNRRHGDVDRALQRPGVYWKIPRDIKDSMQAVHYMANNPAYVNEPSTPAPEPATAPAGQTVLQANTPHFKAVYKPSPQIADAIDKTQQNVQHATRVLKGAEPHIMSLPGGYGAAAIKVTPQGAQRVNNVLRAGSAYLRNLLK